MARDLFAEFGISNEAAAPKFSDMMQGFGSNPPPMPKRGELTGFGGIAYDIGKGLTEAPGAIKGAAGFLKDLIIDQLTPKSSVGDFVTRRNLGYPDQDPYENLKVAGAGIAKGGNILGNMPGNIRDYAARKFPESEYPNVGMEGLPSFRVPGLPDSDYDYLGAIGAPGQEQLDPSQQFIYEIMKRLPLAATSGGNPFALEAQRAAGENENPIPAMATVRAFEAVPSVAKTAGKATKAVAPKVAEVAGKLKPDWVTRESAGKTVGEPAKALQKEISQEYESFKQDAKVRGVKADTAEPITKMIESDIIDPATGKRSVRYETTRETPTLEKVQKDLQGVDVEIQEAYHKALETGEAADIIQAEKMLGQFKARQRQNEASRMAPRDVNAEHRATTAENKLNKYIEEIGEKLDPANARRIFEARTKYKTELRPYLDIEPIARYVKGDLTGADLARILQGNTKAATQFRATLSDQYKAVGRNALFKDFRSMGLKGGVIGTLVKIASGGK